MEVTETKHVVAVCGSQRNGSYTHRALRRALTAAESNGAETDFIDLSDLELPLFDPDRTDAGSADSLRRRIRRADAVLLGTPMYHGSYSSPLKTALDYCGFDEFEETTVGLLAVSGGGFPTPALEHLRSVARELDAWVLPTQVAIPDSHSAFEDGELVDEGLIQRIETLGSQLVDYANVASYPDSPADCAVPTAD